MDKKKLLQLVFEKLCEEKSKLERAARAAHRAAVEAPGAMQSHSDTTKFQMNLASDQMKELVATHAQAIRILSAFLPAWEPKPATTVGLGSLIKVGDDAEQERWYFLLPTGGGTTVAVDGRSITVITPQTPITTAFLGKGTGEIVQIKTPRGSRTFTVVEVG